AAVRANQGGSVSDRYTSSSEWNMRDSCGKRGLDETPQCVKDEGRLKPPFAGNVDIPLAGARRLINRPRKASIFHLRWSRHIILFFNLGGVHLRRVVRGGYIRIKTKDLFMC